MAARLTATSLIRPAALLLLLIGLGCGRPSAPEPREQETAGNSEDPIPPPENGQLELENALGGHTEFALRLYAGLRGAPGNIVCSPWSIRSACAMAYAGARGATATEMAQALCYDGAQEELAASHRDLSRELARRNDPGGTSPQGDPEAPIELHLANSIWGRSDYPFRASFSDLLATYYGSQLQPVDFAADPLGSVGRINAWIAARTQDRIRDLLAPGAVSHLTVAVLVNALHFRAPWEYPFREEWTREGTFHGPAGREITARMMRQEATFHYAEANTFQALEIPYRRRELSMILILPEAARFSEVEAALDEARLREILTDLKVERVQVTLPRFTFASRTPMTDVLQSLGMRLPFAAAEADFRGIVEGLPFWIDQVLHQGLVSVDEKGTEAAAATAVISSGSSRTPPRMFTFIADHPFLFLIRDRATGVILFIGRVTDPVAG